MPKNPTFEQDDKLSRSPYAKSLTDSIEKFYPFSEDAYVLSLDAPFGSGKTMFVKMWQHYLEHQETPFETIYFNAWKHDFCDDPAVPLLVEILQTIESQSPEKVEPLKRALAVLTVGLNEASKQLTGISPLELGEAIKKLTDEEQLSKIGGELYKAFKAQNQVMQRAQAALKAFVEGLPRKPLFIFVDELDRARPDYAVKLLETLKHLFGVQGVCFVLAVDKRHLESSVKTMYGSGLDFENYYKKFVTNQFRLPLIEETSVEQMNDCCFMEFFDEKQNSGISFPFADNEKGAIKSVLYYLTHCFKLTPRQIREYYRTLAHFLAVGSEITENFKPNSDDIELICLIQAIDIKHPDINQKILDDKCDENDISSIVANFTEDSLPSLTRGASDTRRGLVINFVSSLCHEGNSLQLSRLLTSILKEDITQPNLKTHVKRRFGSPAMPQKESVIYRHVFQHMRHWKPFIS